MRTKTPPTDTLHFQEFYPSTLAIQSIEKEDKIVKILAKSTRTEFDCPECGTVSVRSHSTHVREVQDLPILGCRTKLKIELSDFKCTNPNCKKTTFTERYDDFMNDYCRMTNRLVELVCSLALETSCESCARILQKINVKISGDTVIRTLIKRYDRQEKPECGDTVGIDDFSFKKRHSYGTIIVDERTHRPITILDGRNGETLKEWLKNNKHIKTVTRDRASAYASAVEEVLPDCMQIADRFHLHQNLLEAINKILGREIPATVTILENEEVSDSKTVVDKPTSEPDDGKKNCC